MNFKPGDKAIHVGGGMVPPSTEIDIVEVGPWTEGDIVFYRGHPRTFLSPADYLCVIPGSFEFYCPESYLRKPDDFDITEQEWYQKILRGEKLEETA